MVLSDDYFRNLASARPMMEKYNLLFIEKFTAFLENQTYEMLMKVFEVKRDEIARSAGNSYGHIHVLYKLCDIVINEIGAGYVPLTSGVITCEKAIDKYHKFVFMQRRTELFQTSKDMNREAVYIAEAKNYIIAERISPIALSYIIKHEIGGAPQKAINYWGKIYKDAGLEREAILLEEL